MPGHFSEEEDRKAAEKSNAAEDTKQMAFSGAEEGKVGDLQRAEAAETAEVSSLVGEQPKDEQQYSLEGTLDRARALVAAVMNMKEDPPEEPEMQFDVPEGATAASAAAAADAATRMAMSLGATAYGSSSSLASAYSAAGGLYGDGRLPEVAAPADTSSGADADIYAAFSASAAYGNMFSASNNNRMYATSEATADSAVETQQVEEEEEQPQPGTSYISAVAAVLAAAEAAADAVSSCVQSFKPPIQQQQPQSAHQSLQQQQDALEAKEQQHASAVPTSAASAASDTSPAQLAGPASSKVLIGTANLVAATAGGVGRAESLSLAPVSGLNQLLQQANTWAGATAARWGGSPWGTVPGAQQQQGQVIATTRISTGDDSEGAPNYFQQQLQPPEPESGPKPDGSNTTQNKAGSGFGMQMVFGVRGMSAAGNGHISSAADAGPVAFTMGAEASPQQKSSKQQQQEYGVLSPPRPDNTRVRNDRTKGMLQQRRQQQHYMLLHARGSASGKELFSNNIFRRKWQESHSSLGQHRASSTSPAAAAMQVGDGPPCKKAVNAVRASETDVAASAATTNKSISDLRNADIRTRYIQVLHQYNMAVAEVEACWAALTSQQGGSSGAAATAVVSGGAGSDMGGRNKLADALEGVDALEVLAMQATFQQQVLAAAGHVQDMLRPKEDGSQKHQDKDTIAAGKDCNIAYRLQFVNLSPVNAC
jgi:hypothetical protein